MKVLVLTADANTLVYHRGDLIRAFADQGCEVVTSAAEDHAHVRAYVEAFGGRHVPIRMVRSRVNLLRDWITWLDMFRLFRKEAPDALSLTPSSPSFMAAWSPVWPGCLGCMRCFRAWGSRS